MLGYYRFELNKVQLYLLRGILVLNLCGLGEIQARIQTGLSGLYKPVRFLKEKDNFCHNNLILSFRNFFIIYLGKLKFSIIIIIHLLESSFGARNNICN